jgi:hypothetical protein
VARGFKLIAQRWLVIRIATLSEEHLGNAEANADQAESSFGGGWETASSREAAKPINLKTVRKKAKALI